MPSVTPQEVVPGLVVHQETSVLRQLGGSSTNAEATKTQDRAVVGPHYFLVVEVDAAGAVCTAVPLFSASAPGSERLVENLKSGLPALWIGQDSYFSRWQHWRIPVQAVVQASINEQSTPADRRRYAVGNPQALTTIAQWQARNRAPFRAL